MSAYLKSWAYFALVFFAFCFGGVLVVETQLRLGPHLIDVEYPHELEFQKDKLVTVEEHNLLIEKRRAFEENTKHKRKSKDDALNWEINTALETYLFLVFVAALLLGVVGAIKLRFGMGILSVVLLLVLMAFPKFFFGLLSGVVTFSSFFAVLVTSCVGVFAGNWMYRYIFKKRFYKV